MTDPSRIAALRRELVDPTARLIEFLRKLATTRQAVILDVDSHLSVSWLADRPAHLDLDTTAVAGDVFLSIDPVAAEPAPRLPDVLATWVDPVEAANSALDAPSLRQRSTHAVNSEGRQPTGNIPFEAAPSEVQRAYDQWLDRWRVWAEADRRTAVHRSWYETLADAYQQLDQHSDEVELVISAGLFGWNKPSGASVRTHLLNTRAQITVDTSTGRLEVLVDPDATTRIGDRELVGGESGFDSNRADPIRQHLRESVPAPLSDGVKELLERWRTLALARCDPYEHDAWEPISRVREDGTPELRFAPALVLRRRDAASLIGYYDRMLEALSGPDAEAPIGLAQLLTALEPEQRLEWLESEGTSAGGIAADPLFPLPSNDEQRQVMERLRHDNGVVVQGPPGTGKSHSIANLISALLAQGHRVLVTSQKAQALRVLREKLPDDVAELCVSMTDLSRGGSAELNRSVNALSERFGNHDASAHAAQVAELTVRRDSERGRVAVLAEQIRSLRESETYQHSEVAPGYEGTLGAIAARLQAQQGICGWMPTPFPAEAAKAPPLTVDELSELRRLLASSTPARSARVNQDLPALETMPSSPTVRSWFAAEAAASEAAGSVATELSRRLASCSPAVIDAVGERLRAARQDLDAIGLRRGVAGSHWPAVALQARLARQEAVVWEELASIAGRADEARSRLAVVGIRQVTLSELNPSGPGSAGALRAAGQALRDYLAGGGSLRRHLPKPVQRAAQPLLDAAAVDGIPPTTPELLDVVLAHMDAETIASSLAPHWAVVGVEVDPSLPLVRRVGALVEAAEALRRVGAITEARDTVAALLLEAGTPILLNELDRWVELEDALEALVVQREAEAATSHVAEQVAALELRARATNAPPELAAATTALSSRDADKYEDALAALADAHAQKEAQLRSDDLWGRLHSAHPGLAQLLERTSASDDWDGRLAVFPESWAWGKARTFFDSQRNPHLDARLDAELADAVARVEAATARLAAAEAWGHVLGRMDASQARALHIYRQAMSDRGAGKGRYAHKFEAAAREAMVAARGAVPAWIMPLPEVLETVPPDRNSFDVVIVDEASQASIEALFLLWLAPRVIVVGDDRQCAPSQVSHGELQPIFDSLDDFLPDIPKYLRVSFTPKSSLFSLLATRFGSVLRLREHFRCMPEIIGWSSRQFYSDAPLIPLRQYGAERLLPLRTTYVPGAFAEGTSTKLRNPLEAEAIVDSIAECLDDPSYEGKTMGVVVLQGTGQIAMLLNLLHARIPAAAWEQRRLRVGTPPDFQGDERDVVFLSMVVAEPPRAVTMLEWQRRFNVAASRGRDQMWLFHSVTLDALSPSDLRRGLLSYMCHPPAPDARGRLDDVRDDEPHPAFDSLFEQRVFNRIRRRGYHVTPQVEVNGRRIDLVVTGAKGRLAVECDGDAWHGSAEQRADDLHRELGLKRAGWRFWRVRGSEYFFDPDAAMAGLWAALDARGIRPHDLDSVPVEEPAGERDEWLPAKLSDVEGADGLDDDPLGAAGLDLVVPARSTVVPRASAGRSPRHASSRPRNEPLFDERRLLFGPETPGSGTPTPSELRNWGRARGLRVGERGPLNPDLIAAWNQAYPDRRFQ